MSALPAAALDFRGGMALGLKLAQPDRRIVQVIGDGGFHFSSPDSVYAVAQQYQLPVLTVVLDNGGWQAVKSAVQRVYPKGIAAETDQFQSRLDLGASGRAAGFLRRRRAPSARMANASPNRTISPPPSTAALRHSMTATPPCCMSTSRGFEMTSAEGSRNS